jgi:dTDP-4-amino-4,6-dideoxygalactose transaminase
MGTRAIVEGGCASVESTTQDVNMNVPLDVPLIAPVREYDELRGAIDAALARVLESGRFVLGEVVERFETGVARYVGAREAVGVASGTDALRLSLEVLGVGPGDEVIAPAFTFVATAGAILQVGATPAFADIDPATFNLDPGAVEAAITPSTVAIMPVHLFGQMAEMARLEAIAARHGLAIVEDAAQSLGASQMVVGTAGAAGTPRPGVRAGPDVHAPDVHAGALGATGCFSFYPTKNLAGIGDGGLITTNDAQIAARIRTLREPGRWTGSPEQTAIGYNSRLDAVQAAVLGVKLAKLDEWNERRRANASAYDEALAPVDGITPPPEREGNRHIYHQYTVRCADRDEVGVRLRDAGIGFGVYYPVALHRLDALAHLGYEEGAFPEAERAAGEVLSLPVFAHLSEAERDRVVDALA